MFILISFLLAACSPQINPEGPTTVAAQTRSVTPSITKALDSTNATPNAEQSRSAIINAHLAMHLKPNRTEVSTQFADGRTQKNTVDFLPPDRMRLSSEYAEWLIIADKVYIRKTGLAAWQPDSTFQAAIFLPKPPSATDLENKISDVQFIGAQYLDGKAALLYNYKITDKIGGLTLHSQLQLWLAADNYLPLKEVKNGDIYMSSSTADGKPTEEAIQGLMTILFDFTTPFKIEAPEQ
jgi:hypothetical protein